MAPVTTDTRARQGPSGKPVLMVLIGGLALCLVAIVGYLVWTGTSSPDSASHNASRESVTGSPRGAGANPSDRTPAANPAYPAPASPSATGSTTR